MLVAGGGVDDEMFKSYATKKQSNALTFQSLPLILRTTRFNIQKLYIVITWNLCVNKQQVFPYTTLTL